MMKILIADDEKPTARAMETKFNLAGFEAKAVFDGAEALEALSKDKFDLLLLDLMMPKKDGFTVLEELKKKGNKMPIVVTSNLGQAEDAKRVKELGAKDYIIKSSTPIPDIINYIKKILI
ncbi:MAG: response regulator [bacterium]|nr:response regulator [bacterium]